MAIKEDFVNFRNEADFILERGRGNIKDQSIVFIDDAQQIYTHKTMFDGATSDWEAIEGTKGGIKNKPFGEVFTKFWAQNSLKYTGTSNGRYATSLSGIPAAIAKSKIIEGDYIKIKVGDKERVYKVVKDANGWFGLNITRIVADIYFSIDNGEDAIGIYCAPTFTTISLYTNFDPSGMPFEIYAIAEKQIDEKWLPDTVATKEYVDSKPVVNSDWDAEEGEAGFIKNKPFGQKTITEELINFTPDMVHYGPIEDLSIYNNVYFASTVPDYKDILEQNKTYGCQFGDRFFELKQFNENPYETGKYILMFTNNVDFRVYYTVIDNNPSLVFIGKEDFIDKNIVIGEIGYTKLDKKFLPDDLLNTDTEKKKTSYHIDIQYNPEADLNTNPFKLALVKNNKSLSESDILDELRRIILNIMDSMDTRNAILEDYVFTFGSSFNPYASMVTPTFSVDASTNDFSLTINDNSGTFIIKYGVGGLDIKYTPINNCIRTVQSDWVDEIESEGHPLDGGENGLLVSYLCRSNQFDKLILEYEGHKMSPYVYYTLDSFICVEYGRNSLSVPGIRLEISKDYQSFTASFLRN